MPLVVAKEPSSTTSLGFRKVWEKDKSEEGCQDATSTFKDEQPLPAMQAGFVG
jgi:hypothetical protein